MPMARTRVAHGAADVAVAHNAHRLSRDLMDVELLPPPAIWLRIMRRKSLAK